MIKIADQFHPKIYHSIEFFELTIHYFMMRKFKPLKNLYGHIKAHCNKNEINGQIFLVTNDSDFTNWFVTNYEDVYS
jgi:hypothetical protein